MIQIHGDKNYWHVQWESRPAFAYTNRAVALRDILRCCGNVMVEDTTYGQLVLPTSAATPEQLDHIDLLRENAILIWR